MYCSFSGKQQWIACGPSLGESCLMDLGAQRNIQTDQPPRHDLNLAALVSGTNNSLHNYVAKYVPRKKKWCHHEWSSPFNKFWDFDFEGAPYANMGVFTVVGLWQPGFPGFPRLCRLALPWFSAGSCARLHSGARVPWILRKTGKCEGLEATTGDLYIHIYVYTNTQNNIYIYIHIIILYDMIWYYIMLY